MSLRKIVLTPLLFLSLFSGLILMISLSSNSGHASVEGAISGVVALPDGKNAGGATVELMNPEGKVLKTVQSSADGKYQFFPIQIGDYEVTVSLPGYHSYRYGVHVASGGNARTDVAMTALPESTQPGAKEMVVEVRAKKRLIHTSSSTSTTEITQAEIKKLPQGSEISLPRLLTTTTPGVVQGTFGQMFFRGNHANIQYQIDGVQLPDSPSSTFGQSFSPRNIDRMEVITGGIPAEYGQRLAAVVNIMTKSGPEVPGGEVELNYSFPYNTFSPHVMYGGSNESGSLKYFFSANYMSTNRGLDTPNPVDTTPAGQMQGGTDSIHNFASGDTEFGRVDWQVNNSNKVVFTLFHSQNTYQIPNYPASFKYTGEDGYFGKNFTDVFGNGGPDEGPYNFIPSTTNDWQSETNVYAQAVWKHTFSERSFLQIAPYYKYSQIVNGNDPANDMASQNILDPTTNITGPAGTGPSSFSQNRHTNSMGLKADYSIRPIDAHLIKTGFMFQAARSDGYFSLQAVNPTTDLVQTASSADPTTGYFESVYVQDDITVAKWLILNLGLRYDATQFEFSGLSPSDGLLQPRLGANFIVSDSLKFHAFSGLLFQPAPVENLRSTFNALGLDQGNNAVPYDIKAEKDVYFEVGVAHQLLEKQVVSLNGFYKWGINVLDDQQLARTPIAQPFNFAQGFVYGAEVSLKGQIAKDWSNFLNYSYLIAEGRGNSGGIWATGGETNPNYQPMDHAQTHTINGGLTYSKNGFWSTAQALFGSGLRTGPDNSLGLPAHLTFDLTVGYEFQSGWLKTTKVSVDCLNIGDNRYPITIANGFNGSHYAAGRQVFLRLSHAL